LKTQTAEEHIVAYPVIRVCGEPRERGRQYGAAARDRVHRSIDGYAAVFEARLGYCWADAVRDARAYRDAVGDLSAAYLAEMDGIAEGAGLEPEDVLALNVRTELMARAFRASLAAAGKTDGCTALAVLPGRTTDGHLLIGQTWDWLAHTVSSVVVLETDRDDGPPFVTVVEAGLLAKTGMNSAGLALCTNFMLTETDGTATGVPYHLTLRAIFDAETLPEAYASLQRMSRASSGNYLLGHADGVAVDIEAPPGGAGQLRLQYPQDQLLIHANHFCGGEVDGDISLVTSPDSPFRQDRLGSLLTPEAAGPITVDRLKTALGDHASFPRSICAHSDLRVAAHERETSAFGLIMEPAERRMYLADGNPCVAPWRELPTASELLSRAREPSLADVAPALFG
jgi:isopenicillin-N N-acyltransferase-like protein